MGRRRQRPDLPGRLRLNHRRLGRLGRADSLGSDEQRQQHADQNAPADNRRDDPHQHGATRRNLSVMHPAGRRGRRQRWLIDRDLRGVRNRLSPMSGSANCRPELVNGT